VGLLGDRWTTGREVVVDGTDGRVSIHVFNTMSSLLPLQVPGATEWVRGPTRRRDIRPLR
jgi:hypothetical protein